MDARARDRWRGAPCRRLDHVFDTITGVADNGVRVISPPFVVPGPSGVAVRTRLKGLTAEDEQVLRLVGAHLGALAGRDLKARPAWGIRVRRGQSANVA